MPTTTPTDEIPPGVFDDRGLLDIYPALHLRDWENELRARESHLREQEHLAAQRELRLISRERTLAWKEAHAEEVPAADRPRQVFFANRFLKLA
jgi:hypothetical protein